MTVRVTCHCAAVEVAARLSEPFGNARRCDCSFCVRRGAAVVFASAVEVVRGAEDLTLYRWGTMTERHWFCRRCGIYTHHDRGNGEGYGVNLGAVEGVEPSAMEPIPWVDGKGYVPPARR